MIATVIATVLIVVGIFGVVVPVLPGVLLCWAGVLVWALSEPSTARWTALAVVTLIWGLGAAIKYILPGRLLRSSGVPWSTLAVGTVAGVIGFFVIPLLGVVLGFVLGVYLAERLRLHKHGPAWTSTVAALKGAGLSILIELTSALLIAATFAAALAVKA